MASVDTADLDSFLSKVSLVHDTIKGLRDGTVAPQDTQHVIQQIQSPPRHKEEEEECKQQILERPPTHSYRPGKGISDDYSLYCTPCHLEYLLPCQVCSRCSAPLIKGEDRRSYLHAQLEELKQQKEKRAQRRQRFQEQRQQLLQQQQQQPATTTTIAAVQMLPNSAWEDYEPSSDDDDTILPNPNFAALESDLQQRQTQRQQNQQRAEQQKQLGNQAYSQHDYTSAITHYTQAIQLHKTHKPYYTNRALCYLHTQQYTACIQDCTDVWQIWKYLENGQEKKKMKVAKKEDVLTVVKALLRRSQAYQALRQWTAAQQDLSLATSFADGLPHKIMQEIQQVLEQLGREKQEWEKEQTVKSIKTSSSTPQQQPALPPATAGLTAEEEKQQCSRAPAHTTRECHAFTCIQDLLVYLQTGDAQQSESSLLTSLNTAYTILQNKHDACVFFRCHQGFQIIIPWLTRQWTELVDATGAAAAAATPSTSASWSVYHQVQRLLMLTLFNDKNKQVFIEQKGLDWLLLVVQDVSVLTEQQEDTACNIAWNMMKVCTEHSLCRKQLFSKHEQVCSKWIARVTANKETAAAEVIPLVLRVLANLAYDKMWKETLYTHHATPLLSMIRTICHSNTSTKQHRQQHFITTLTPLFALLANILTLKSWRDHFAADDTMISTLCHTVIDGFQLRTAKHSPQTHGLIEMQEKMMAVVLNLTVLNTLLPSVCQLLSPLLPTFKTWMSISPAGSTVSPLLRTRVFVLISRAAAQQSSMKQWVIESNVCQSAYHLLQEGVRNDVHQQQRDETTENDDDITEDTTPVQQPQLCVSLTEMESCIRLLCLCASEPASLSAIPMPALITTLAALLCSASTLLTGNAALLLSLLAQRSELLREMSCVILPLLSVMKKWSGNTQIKGAAAAASNAAIACARLSAFPAHLAVIRANQGMSLMLAAGQQVLKKIAK